MTTDIRAIVEPMAAARNIPLSHLLAVIDVESAGRVFHAMKGKAYPLILPEPHRLYALTKGEVRDRLVAEGLASRTWNKKLYPKSQEQRWANIKRAQEIAGGVAYEPVSYGVGQVLGEHWRALGYASLDAFLKVMFSGAAGQIEIMLKFIEHNGLDDELREGRWPAFFRGYNGPRWKENGYGDKIANALAEHGGANPKPDGMLRMGAKGVRVRELQALLTRAGYPVTVDADFGPTTKAALKAYQAANGLKADGVCGPETQRMLGELRQSAADKPGAQKPTEVKEVIEGASTIGGGVIVETLQNKVDDATTQLQAIDGLQPWLGYGLAALSIVALALGVAGALWALHGWWKSRQTVEA